MCECRQRFLIRMEICSFATLQHATHSSVTTDMPVMEQHGKENMSGKKERVNGFEGRL